MRRAWLNARAMRWMGVVCLVMAGACKSQQTPPPQTVVDLNGDRQGSGKTMLRVENQNLADVTIYVYRSTQRLRLGRVSGNSSASLEIPRTIVLGLTELRFQAEPLGQRGILSQPISVSPGDVVDFIVPAH